jgi:hypothetical protein
VKRMEDTPALRLISSLHLIFFNDIGLTLILFLMEASFLWKDSAPLQNSPSS